MERLNDRLGAFRKEIEAGQIGGQNLYYREFKAFKAPMFFKKKGPIARRE